MFGELGGRDGQGAAPLLAQDKRAVSQIDVAHEGVVPNPTIRHYKLMKVTSPPVRRWRVDND